MRVEQTWRTAAQAWVRPGVAGAIVAVPRGWGEPTDVDPAAELGSRATVRAYDAAAFADPRAWTDVVALVPGDHHVDAAVMDRMPALRIVSVDGTGVWDRVEVPAATARGIAVCNVRDYAADAVAEFTVGALIALSRHLVAAAQEVRRGEWAPDAFIGTGLRDRTLGLVGFGVIGSRVAELAQALGMRLLCATAHPDMHRPGNEAVEFVPLAELLDRCDVVSLHARLDEGTRGLIGAAELSRLRPGSLLVNTARAGLIDEAALVEALRSGRLAGAALDVAEPEPLPSTSPLLALDSVLLTPHIAASTYEARRAAVRACLSHVTAFLGGKPTSVVNPEALFAP